MNKLFVVMLIVLIFLTACAREELPPPTVEVQPNITNSTQALPKENITQPKECSTDIKFCADGTFRYRAGPTCEFLPCTEPLPKPVPKPHSGGGGGGGGGSGSSGGGSNNSNEQTLINNTIIGVEYAFPGQANALAELGITGVKFYPETYTMWGAMQNSSNESVNFTALDAMVLEYQTAGFTNIIFGMRHQSTWGSINASALTVVNPLPKPEYQQAYEDWWRAVVERYDGDGINDMAGLLYPINYYEIGVEFSTYEPEAAEDYVQHLATAYDIAHTANPNAVVAHVAFLTLGGLDDPVSQAQYEAAFNNIEDTTHNLSDMRIILDHPESFDILNIHSLGDPREIPRIVQFFTSEMNTRGYNKSIIISDTSATPFIAYGPADTCIGSHGTTFYPANDSDLCRLASYFDNLINETNDTVTWVRGFVAADMVKRATIASHQGILQLNLGFTEDLNELIFKQLLHAGTGNSAWGGLLNTTVAAGSQQRTVTGRYPPFYAVQQLQHHLVNYTSIEKISLSDDFYVYNVTNATTHFYIAWKEPEYLILPGDTVPSGTINIGTGTVTIEHVITEQGQTTPTTEIGTLDNITVTPTPIFILP